MVVNSITSGASLSSQTRKGLDLVIQLPCRTPSEAHFSTVFLVGPSLVPGWANVNVLNPILNWFFSYSPIAPRWYGPKLKLTEISSFSANYSYPSILWYPSLLRDLARIFQFPSLCYGALIVAWTLLLVIIDRVEKTQKNRILVA